MIGMDFHKELLERSLVSMGNNSRMKRAVKKAKAGKEVTLVYLGGSITNGYNGGEDSCYAKLSCDYYYNRFGKVNYINVSSPGSNSTLGLIRVEEDVLVHKPDVVFLDYAVNDTKESVSREAFESLLRRLIKSESRPAVVLLFMISDVGYTCQGHMQAIGEHYSLPMISCGDALLPAIESGRMTWADFLSDNIHPNANGHKLLSEFITNYFNRLEASEEDPEYIMPNTPFYGNSFEDMKLLDNTNAYVEALGSFDANDSGYRFLDGWGYNNATGNKSLIIRQECRNVFIVHKESCRLDTGCIEICLDGRLSASIQGYGSLGFDNPVATLLLKDNISRSRTISARMSSQDIFKEFTILAFGYS